MATMSIPAEAERDQTFTTLHRQIDSLIQHLEPTHSSLGASFQRSVCTPGRCQPACGTRLLPWCHNQTYISILLLPHEPGEPGNDCRLHATGEGAIAARHFSDMKWVKGPFKADRNLFGIIPLWPVITQPMQGVSLNMLVTVAESSSLSWASKNILGYISKRYLHLQRGM